MKKIEYIKPGTFSKNVPTDARRQTFDFYNESIICTKKRPDVLFIGDSITELWELYAYFDTDKFLVNRGIGGDTSEYLLKRLEADCLQLNPKTVVLMIGTNNIFRAEPDYWWRQDGIDRETVLEEYKQDILQIIEKIESKSIELVLCSVPPSEIAPPFDRELRFEMTAKMNEFLKSLGKTFVDYTDVLSNDGKTLIYDYSPDGIHPNAYGYTEMAKKLKEYIDL